MRASTFLLTAIALTALLPSGVTAASDVPYPENQLEVSITDHRDTALPGEKVEYLLYLRNPESIEVMTDVRIKIPSTLVDVQEPQRASFNGREIVWHSVRLKPGVYVSLVFSATISRGLPGSYPIQVVARAGNVIASDRTLTAAPDDASIRQDHGAGSISPYGDNILALKKTVDRTNALAGSVVSYSLTVRNMQNIERRNISIVDAYDPAVLSITDAGAGDVDDDRGRITWQADSLRPGESRTFVYTGRVSRALHSGASILNTARAYIDGDDVGYIPHFSAGNSWIMPQTGVEDYFGQPENTGRFLSPVTAAERGDGWAMGAWIALISTGMTAVLFGRNCWRNRIVVDGSGGGRYDISDDAAKSTSLRSRRNAC